MIDDHQGEHFEPDDDESSDDEEQMLHALDVGVQFYMRGREQPVSCLAVMLVHPLYAKQGPDIMTDMALEMLLDGIDTRGATRQVWADSHGNKTVIMLEDLQAVTVIAPDASQLERIASHVED